MKVGSTGDDANCEIAGSAAMSGAESTTGADVGMGTEPVGLEGAISEAMGRDEGLMA